MKKLFFPLLFLAAMAVSFHGHSQTNATLVVSGSPITNAASATLLTTTLGSYYESLGLQVVITRTSGAIAGTAALQGTIDGTNWFAISSSALTDVASQTFGFAVDKVAYNRYRVVVTTTGTSVTAVTGKYVYKGRR